MRGTDMQSPLPWDAAEVRQALDKPAAAYLEYASRPSVAAALAQFRSERDVHQTERLDLVTWVQYICAFGCAGPSEDAWTQLFHACRFPNRINVDHHASTEDLCMGDYLREHEIAILLAHAKVAPESSDSMTHAALIKHRIRPAVFGRNDARTPGIVRHVSEKFEDWIFGYMTKWMCHYIVEEFSPSAFLPGFADFTMIPNNVQLLKNCADAHAAKNVKDWGDVVMHLLEIDHNTVSPRAARFEEKAQETRTLLFLQFYSKISEFWLNSIQNGALSTADPATVVHSAIKTEATARVHYRCASAVTNAGNARTQDTLLYAAVAAGGRQEGSAPVLTAPAYATIKALCGLRAAPRLLSVGRMIRSVVRVLELHAPKYLGEASIEFVNVDEVKDGSVRTGRSMSDPSSVNVRLGDFRSPLRMTTLPSATSACECRALEIEVCVGVLPPARGVRGSRGSDVPVLRVMDFGEARWIGLGKECGGCEELEKLSEMGIECDGSGSEADAHKLAFDEDPASKWLVGAGVSASLAGAQAAQWTCEHVCNGLRKFSYRASVPARIANDARREGGYLPRGSVEGVEEFKEHCWIDCHTGARTSYQVRGGVELAAKAPNRRWIFDRVPVWRWRAS